MVLLTDVEIAANCIKLVRQLLEEHKRGLKINYEHGRETWFIEYEIHREEYALGLRDDFPDIQKYKPY